MGSGEKEAVRQDKGEGGRRIWEVRKWLYDVSLEVSWMTLLTPLNKTKLM